MSDVFLSYAREDKARAALVADGLEAAGLEVFWDKEIPPGQSWADYLESRLNTCKVCVVLWSMTSTASQWVKEEARLARERGKLIPAQLDQSAPPFGFGEVQAANLTNWSGNYADPDWQRFIAAVQAKAGKAVTAPAPRPVATPAAVMPPPPPPISVSQPQPYPQAQPQPRPLAQAPNPSMFGGSAPAAPPVPTKQALPGWVWGVVGALVLLVGIIILGLFVGENTSTPAPGQASVSSGPGPQREVPAGVRDIVGQARQIERDATSAVTVATSNAVAGRQAGAAAQAGQPGYAVQQLPQGLVAGQLSRLPAFEAVPVTMSGLNNVQFFGVMQARQDGGYSMDGEFSQPGLSIAGRFEFNSSGTYDFVGVANNSGKYMLHTRERGTQGQNVGRGVGVITYPDGRRYEGEYRSVGEGAQAQLFRNGRGAFLDARGDVIEAGTFDNDRLVGP